MRYIIKINDNPVATSDDFKKAMNRVQFLVANYAGVRNENFVNLGEGIIYCPWGNFAHCKAEVDDETYQVVICEIKEL